jgi:hypothetical protein
MIFLYSLIRSINSDQGNCCELTKEEDDILIYEIMS